jgi:hypothetical protein
METDDSIGLSVRYSSSVRSAPITIQTVNRTIQLDARENMATTYGRPRTPRKRFPECHRLIAKPFAGGPVAHVSSRFDSPHTRGLAASPRRENRLNKEAFSTASEPSLPHCLLRENAVR